MSGDFFWKLGHGRRERCPIRRPAKSVVGLCEEQEVSRQSVASGFKLFFEVQIREHAGTAGAGGAPLGEARGHASDRSTRPMGVRFLVRDGRAERNDKLRKDASGCPWQLGGQAFALKSDDNSAESRSEVRHGSGSSRHGTIDRGVIKAGFRSRHPGAGREKTQPVQQAPGLCQQGRGRAFGDEAAENTRDSRLARIIFPRWSTVAGTTTPPPRRTTLSARKRESGRYPMHFGHFPSSCHSCPRNVSL